MYLFFTMQDKIFGNFSVHCSLTFQIPLDFFNSWHLEFVNNNNRLNWVMPATMLSHLLQKLTIM